MWHCSLLSALPFVAPLACIAPVVDHRVVVYYQTTHYNSSTTSDVSLLPLVQDTAHVSATHVLISAVHIVDDDGGIRLNDHAPDNQIFDHVWSDAATLQAAGVTVMAMVGGAAAGSWDRLDGDNDKFEKYYKPLHDFVGGYNIQGLDLDVEQSMSLDGIIRLIDRLKKDFGNDFIISLAPVGSALTKGGGNLSGFDYFQLEAKRGKDIAFYNAQFYFGWGDASSATNYEDIIDDGFPTNKVVMGLLTNPANGNGYVNLDKQTPVLKELVAENPKFGGVAGWEYFNSLPGGTSAPHKWAAWIAEHIGKPLTEGASQPQAREISVSESVRRSVRRSYRRVRALGKGVFRDYIA
ncbi:glycoside hydrolase superfamily [Microdochium bolleyi]|uniref:Glycoside hydrolase superfamily n=1 Tax=Microdochium bolleyi TaxID=196109 RepID=A0A136JC61_9PEZI|nr:glycoside hydrolase superfamily [Microdochium bolleyi]